MPKSHRKFHSFDDKRNVLVVDDEFANRQILGKKYLQETYEVMYAENGAQALDVIRANKDTLSVVLLDLLMPVMSGFDVLKEMRGDPELKRIPVIVMTSEQDAEVESLKLGANDFIPKPYPDIDVVLARVEKTIDLSEREETMESTERDVLTGLYNREYFYHYADQLDQYHKDREMDAVILDVNHFRMFNERYGRARGDELLRTIGEKLLEIVQMTGGIACRREADTFMIYLPHRDDYEQLIECLSTAESGDAEGGTGRIRLRFGIYPNADKSIDIERRFDRAQMASNSIRGSLVKTIETYNDELHKRELYAEQLIEDFQKAIEENQFTVYYQPKFDVTHDTPVLAGAEALVRWIHPELGFISPGTFIPLFEENGLIQRLDSFVWQETARQIREWKDNLSYSVPVSVNMSRIDMFDPGVFDTLENILKEHSIVSRDLHLEVTESAYTQDSDQILETVAKLRESGFKIEMDDFGTGYSSLNMVSSLAIDTLKLDMQFVRDAFREGGNTHMLKIILDIAEFLDVPVIAEGVETEEQLDRLKEMGCEMVQGYFFSKPVPAKDFEPFILQRKEVDKLLLEEQGSGALPGERESGTLPGERKSGAPQDGPESGAPIKHKKHGVLRGVSGGEILSSLEEPKIDEEIEERYIRQGPGRTGLHLRTANIFFVIIAFIAATALLISDISVNRGYQRMEEASDRYIAAQMATSDMESGSDYLTDRVRCFVATGEIEYLDDFFEEVDVTKRRDLAVENLEKLLQGSETKATTALNTALTLSNELVNTEYLAMRLRLAAGDYDMNLIPKEILNTPIPKEYRDMTEDQLLHVAQDLVFNDNYMLYKDRIRENVGLCTQELIRSSSHELENASARMSLLVHLQTGLTILLLLIVLFIVIIISREIRKPLTRMVKRMQSQELVIPEGAEELRFVTRTYNTILHENQLARERLSHEASHDALTGLFNRGAYDMLMDSVDTAHMALILIDVDDFKGVNDHYGHVVGDRVLKRVAEILRGSFRSVDIICRIGGDEFVVVMTRVNSSVSQLVQNKIRRANEMLQNPKDDLPAVSLSVGVAFSDRNNPKGDIFRDADTALYQVKNAGRNGCKVYGE